VIRRPVSILDMLEFSDGTHLKVTADHPFWVDGGQELDHAGWVRAGDIRVGDRLRTATGHDVIVVRVHSNVGRAIVYTLTVAQDHTFFVGQARVLVHNAGGACQVQLNAAQGKAYEIKMKAAYEQAGFIVETGESITTPIGVRKPDLVIKSKDGRILELIELKSSATAKYPIDQELKDIWIENALGYITSVVRP
jgi:hypothetical protein